MSKSREEIIKEKIESMRKGSLPAKAGLRITPEEYEQILDACGAFIIRRNGLNSKVTREIYNAYTRMWKLGIMNEHELVTNKT